MIVADVPPGRLFLKDGDVRLRSGSPPPTDPPAAGGRMFMRLADGRSALHAQANSPWVVRFHDQEPTDRVLPAAAANTVTEPA